MYAVQYGNRSLAADTMAAMVAGKGLAACASYQSCRANGRSSVNIARKIEQLKTLSSNGILAA